MLHKEKIDVVPSLGAVQQQQQQQQQQHHIHSGGQQQHMQHMSVQQHPSLVSNPQISSSMHMGSVVQMDTKPVLGLDWIAFDFFWIFQSNREIRTELITPLCIQTKQQPQQQQQTIKICCYFFERIVKGLASSFFEFQKKRAPKEIVWKVGSKTMSSEILYCSSILSFFSIHSAPLVTRAFQWRHGSPTPSSQSS